MYMQGSIGFVNPSRQQQLALLSMVFPQVGPLMAGAELLAGAVEPPPRRPPRPEGIGFVDPATGMLIAQGVMAAGSAIFGWVSRRGKQKVAATQIVDEAERHLENNLTEYLKAPASPANQAAGIGNFEAVWGQVVTACSDPQLGSAGRRCISERQRGGQWDWFARYLDPIAQDPRVAEVTRQQQQASSQAPWLPPITAPLTGGVPWGLLAGAGLLLVGVLA